MNLILDLRTAEILSDPITDKEVNNRFSELVKQGYRRVDLFARKLTNEEYQEVWGN